MKQQPKAVREAIRFLKACIIPVGMWLLFAILTGGRTASQRMFLNTMRQSVTASVICYGLMLNMSVGMLNFSAGAMIAVVCSELIPESFRDSKIISTLGIILGFVTMMILDVALG